MVEMTLSKYSPLKVAKDVIEYCGGNSQTKPNDKALSAHRDFLKQIYKPRGYNQEEQQKILDKYLYKDARDEISSPVDGYRTYLIAEMILHPEQYKMFEQALRNVDYSKMFLETGLLSDLLEIVRQPEKFPQDMKAKNKLFFNMLQEKISIPSTLS